MEVIADRAARALRQHDAALVKQRLGFLVSADFAPVIVKLSGHAEVGNAERLEIAGAHREVLVAPAGGRQRLDFEMTEETEHVVPAAPDVTVVEEERSLRIVLPHRLADALIEPDL